MKIRKTHAERQRQYAGKKKESASRKCIWVPIGKEDDFFTAVKKLKKKWST